MTDTIKRLGGPSAPAKADAGSVLYTPGAGVTAAVKKAIITNHDPSIGGWVSMSVGAMATHDNRFVSGLFVPAATTLVIPLDLVVSNAAGDVIRARQTVDLGYASAMSQVSQALATAGIASTTDGTSFATTTWASTASTLYYMTVVSTHASAAEAPSSFTDTHSGISWQQVQTKLAATGTTRMSMYRAQSSTASAAVATTVNFTGTMTGCFIIIVVVTGGDVSGTNGDEGVQAGGIVEVLVADASATPHFSYPTEILGGSFYAVANGLGGAHTPATNFTELTDASIVTPTMAVATAYMNASTPSVNPIPSTGYAANTLVGFLNIQPPYDVITVSLHGVEVT